MAALHDHVARGNALMARRQYGPAIDEYQKCFEIDPNNQVAKGNIALAHNNWGILYFSQKKYDEANAEWQQSLKIQPNQVSARRNLQILQATLDRLGLQLGYDEPADKGADKAVSPDGAGPEEKASGAKGKGAKGETGKNESGQLAGEPVVDGAPSRAKGNQGKATYIKGSRKVMLTTGVNDQDSEQSGVDSPDAVPKSSPTSQTAPKAPTVPKASAQTADTKRVPAGDAFGQGQAGQIMSYPSTLSGGASMAPTNIDAGTVPGVIGSSKAPVQQPSQQPPQQSKQQTEQQREQQWSQQSVHQPVQPQQPAPGQYDMDAAAQSSQYNSNSGAVMIYPPAQPVAPLTEQIYEDKSAGTSIKIISKPQAPVQVVAPQTVQQPEVVIPTPVQQPPVSSEPTPVAASSPLNIDESLAALELKVFGKKQKSKPVLKRLEKLEIGTSGAASQGTVQERIDALRRAYGL
jgi:hypothetical protein